MKNESLHPLRDPHPRFRALDFIERSPTVAFMNTTLRNILATAALCSFAVLSIEPAHAGAYTRAARHDARQKLKAAQSSEEIATTSAAPRASGGGGGLNRISLGLTTIGTMPGTAGTGVSALFDFGEGNTLQTFLSVGYVSAFSAGVGGIFRHDLKTSGDSGFHVGGGLTIGVGSSTVTITIPFVGTTTTTAFGFGLLGFGVGGFHVAIPGTSGNLTASFDASLGAGFTANAGGAAFFTNLSALSSALGLSLHYAL